jgi:hypothetical protein
VELCPNVGDVLAEASRADEDQNRASNALVTVQPCSTSRGRKTGLPASCM